MSNDELMLLSSLDQSLSTDNDWVLNRVEEIIAEAVAEKDASKALNLCKTLREISQLSGLGLAKALYLIYKNWENFGLTDNFENTAYEYLGLNKITVTNYVRIWSMFDEKVVPEEYAEPLMQHNIKDLVPIANTIAQGYELEEHDWEELADAPDFSSVQIKCRDIKGQPPRKNSLQLFLNPAGEIWAYQQDQRYLVGYLEIETDKETVKKAIERITRAAGIMGY